MDPLIQEASISGLIRVIFIVLIIYAVYSLLIRYIIPALMRKYVNDFQKQFTQQNKRAQEEMNKKKEGEVSIKFVNKDKNNSQHTEDGEYVDYEEIK